MSEVVVFKNTGFVFGFMLIFRVSCQRQALHGDYD